jgi:hypothetical protein
VFLLKYISLYECDLDGKISACVKYDKDRKAIQMKKIKRKKPKLKKVMTTCCWCGFHIGDNRELFGLGARKRPEIDISKYQGGVMPIRLATIDKTIWSIVPRFDSDACKDGKDIMFTLCSEACGEKLRDVLKYETELGKIIYSADSIGPLQ